MKNKLFDRMLVAISLTCICLSFSMRAQESEASPLYEEDYWYLGAQGGSIRYQHGCEDWVVSCEKRDTAIGLFAGYQFNPNFSLEAEWLDLGQVDAIYSESGLNNVYAGIMTGWDISIGYEFLLTETISPFAKLGLFNWRGKNETANRTLTDDGISPTGTLGMKYHLNDHWQARIAYQYISDLGSEKLGSSNGHIGWLGIAYRFRKTKAIPPVTQAPPPQPKKETPVMVAPVSEITVIPAQSATILFDFDSSVFKNTASFDALVTHTHTYPATTITIKAYTDSKGARDYNLWLSKRRAESISKQLQAKGISQDRITIEYFGEDDPVLDNQTAEHRSLNRRAVVSTSEIEIKTPQGDQ